ncbi:hypothetical protein QJS04_geneDACA004173 [Acorus gramineus]|uniref:Male-enhanced antigen 1 n=1 Tax=Acorus gramineus TaxID=55184 RepID=A0AAV9BDH7_ACOGR|nr:hypothetical protein QJS04_geneDACA004173 [Acorus gramineus]
MAEEGDIWQTIVSSVVSTSGGSIMENVCSHEDEAWVDSCLAQDAELSDETWNSLKEALLDIISSQTTVASNNEPSPADGDAMSEGNDNPALIEEHEETDVALRYIKDDFIPHPLVDNVDSDSEDDTGPMSDIGSTENIFRVWDLEIPAEEEDELVKQLNKALGETSTDAPAPKLGDRSTSQYKIDDLVDGLADLSLKPWND